LFFIFELFSQLQLYLFIAELDIIEFKIIKKQIKLKDKWLRNKAWRKHITHSKFKIILIFFVVYFIYLLVLKLKREAREKIIESDEKEKD
jgi:hypothetical protein